MWESLIESTTYWVRGWLTVFIPLAICIGAPGIAACLMTYCRLAGKQEQRMLTLMRQSMLYSRLYAKMEALKHHDIDELRIEPNGVTVT